MSSPAQNRGIIARRSRELRWDFSRHQPARDLLGFLLGSRGRFLGGGQKKKAQMS